MTPDQILAFVLALTSPQPAAPAFPVIAAGGADNRYPVKVRTLSAPPGPLRDRGPDRRLRHRLGPRGPCQAGRPAHR
jgi:hypothetical protein